MAADNRIPELLIILKEHPDIIYTSKLINISDIVQEYKVRNNQNNKYDIGDQNKKRKNQPDICGSAPISFEIPVVSDRSKLDQG
ncbi:34373_t:CDS:2 [Gigaspora margarita]|uniref:34373_t:CDS:1 n=1 Tax=Gigaspora margarita TaxID=4874 RepID=A0ABM8VXH2_GIGMA|nr:34373_t:CDS:2 [Gigaspora margarita]